MKYSKNILLENLTPGVQIIAENLPRYYSFSLGIFINRGSRDETPEINGITHLIEHMLFKGTSKKSALEIVRLIEGLGGSFDAFTTRENLVIVTKFLSEHLLRIFDLILEMLLDSKIVEEGFTKEKSVILEEIKSSNEDPAEYVFDLLFKTIFNNHSMGMPIAGTVGSVSNIDLKTAWEHYREILKNKKIIVISGKFNYDEFLKLAQKRFTAGNYTAKPRLAPEKFITQNIVQTRKDISQVHIAFAIPSVEYKSPIRHHLILLNALFGGGMSSRLFQRLREKEGLVYEVYSFLDLYSDCGILGFYFNCDKKNLKSAIQCVKSIFNEINKNRFEPNEVEIAKTYVTGNLLLSLENSTNRMLRLGREFSYLERVTSIRETVNKIKRITVDELNDLIGSHFFLPKYASAVVGPVEQSEWERILDEIRS
uniref:Insulinase family protein n=1 Tax=candidate division WOR-3 bacterium TaxID=2052148 RepID=A0A7C4TGJ1_UNCW3